MDRTLAILEQIPASTEGLELDVTSSQVTYWLEIKFQLGRSQFLLHFKTRLKSAPDILRESVTSIFKSYFNAQLVNEYNAAKLSAKTVTGSKKMIQKIDEYDRLTTNNRTLTVENHHR